MSWWDTSGFGNFATKALKNAQKKIDKVLDIENEDVESSEVNTEKKSSKPSAKLSSSSKDETKSEGGSSWNSWLGSVTDKVQSSETKSESDKWNSWSLPAWRMSSDESSTSNVGEKNLGTSSTLSKPSDKSVLKKTSFSAATTRKQNEKIKSTSESLQSKDTKSESKIQQDKLISDTVLESAITEITDSVKSYELSDNQSDSSDTKSQKQNTPTEKKEKLNESDNKSDFISTEKEILQSLETPEEDVIQYNKSVKGDVKEDDLLEIKDTADSSKQTNSDSVHKVELKDERMGIAMPLPAESSEGEKISDSDKVNLSVISSDMSGTENVAADFPQESKSECKKDDDESSKTIQRDTTSDLSETEIVIQDETKMVPISLAPNEGNSDESLFEQVTRTSSLPSVNNEQCSDTVSVVSQVDSAPSYSSDIIQSGWTSDVSWESIGDQKLPGDSSNSSAINVNQVSVSNETSDDSNVNVLMETKVEITELKHESEAEIPGKDIIHEDIIQNDNDSNLQSVNVETKGDEVSEEMFSVEGEQNIDLKPEEMNQKSVSGSSASLEIIDSTDVMNEASEVITTTDSLKSEKLEHESSENKASVNDEPISGVDDALTLEKESEMKNVDKDERKTEASDSDPVIAYIGEVVSHDLPLSPSAASSLGGTDSDNSKLDSSMDTYTSEDTVIDRDKQEEEEETEEVNDNSASSGSPSSSFVKCMLEDAMEDGCKMEDNGSDSHSTGGEKSECSRSTGGHESGDEIDTTTSSDIEIISTPTSNGNDKIIDLSPLKIALQKTAKKGSQTHKRSDSQSSSSTQSREGHVEQLSPGRDHGLEHHEGDVDAHYYGDADLPPLSEEAANDPYSPQKLLKLQTVPEHATFVMHSDNDIAHQDNTDVHSMTEKLAEMSEILQVRENKLVQLSRENNDLLESNSILRNQLQQSEEARESEMTDLENLTAEFSERMGESEKKIQTALREKESLKKQLQQAQEEFGKKDSNVSKILQEKDQQITELLQEGEKLSKQQLQSNNIIKKLRVKEKESDSLITTQKKKLEEQKTELEHLRKVLDSKEEMEKKQSDAINQLNAAVQKQEREMGKYKSEYDDNQERIRGLQAALDNSYKEIAELNKSNAAQDSKAQETALSVEMQVREELKLLIEREQLKHKHEKEALIMQMEDLRLTMSRMEKEHNRREDMLRQEISDLQMQLQEDEVRNQELTQSVTSATRPLLRQIENLQYTYTAQSSSWEKIEKNLADRLMETQTQLANAVEKERSASEKLMEITTKITSMESQNSRLKQDKSQLTAELEIIKTKVELLEDAKTNEMAQIEAVKHQMSQEISQLKKEKVFVETQLDMEKTKLDQEKKKLAIAHEQITQLEREAQRAVSVSRGTPSPVSVSRTESISSEPPMFSSLTPEDLERSFFLANPVSGGNKTSLYDSLRQSGAANLLENLQSQLKLREGEITQLQSDIQQLERTRESMARELVNLSNQNDELQEKVKELPEMIEKYRDLDQRNNALLLMYGEKVEEANELRMDLEDVKEMYKAQIDHLLAK